MSRSKFVALFSVLLLWLLVVMIAISSSHVSHVTDDAVAGPICHKDGCKPPILSQEDGSQKQHLEETGKFKKILYWTHFFGHTDFEFGFGNQPFVDAGCAVTNCWTTADKNMVEDADALLWHMRNVDSKTPIPSGRKNKQRYIFFLQEHPYHQWNNLRNWNNFFNLTMTYRRDSDVPVYYGRTEKIEDTDIKTRQPKSEKVKRQLNLTDALVATFISNCNTHSKREDYIKELQKHLLVDVYGECGPLKCPEDPRIRKKHEYESCYDMLEKNYKFYLSFENIYCQDYVTEKLFNILKRDVIPVVMGGTNYARDAPPKSVVNVDDFKSPRDLARFLTSLALNPTEYESYFKWKDSYRILGPKETFKEGFCRLCEVLNDRSYPIKSYASLDEWWGKTRLCEKDSSSRTRVQAP